MARQSVFANGKRGAVSLTYDDALHVHLDHAMPDLESAGLRGTFYVPTRQHPNWSWETRAGDWRRAFERGHEIGNHTQKHPCAASYSWVPRGNALEDYDMQRMETELKAAEEDIAATVGKRVLHSFAYTCCQEYVGPDRKCFRPLVRKMFPVARGGDDRIADPVHTDLANVPSLAVVEKTPLADLLAFIDQAIDEGGWAVFMFHGVGGEHSLNITRENHQAICQHIVKRQDVLWCDTFLNVGLHIRRELGMPWEQ